MACQNNQSIIQISGRLRESTASITNLQNHNTHSRIGLEQFVNCLLISTVPKRLLDGGRVWVSEVMRLTSNRTFNKWTQKIL